MGLEDAANDLMLTHYRQEYERSPDATEPLAAYIQEADAGPVVVLSEGRPIAALVALENTDLETISLSTNPEFLEIIQRSRDRQAREGGLSSAEVRRLLED